jgi:RNA polymerase sigma factor (sigma-70 family)
VATGAAEDWVGASAGEPGFGDVYQSHYTRLVVLARLLTGSTAVAEEIVQDAFVQLFRNWSKVDYPITYVRIAVVNLCRSYGRRRVLERRHAAVTGGEPVLFDATAIAVRGALSALTPRQRAAVILRYYEDLPEREIARVLGCRPGTVKSLLARSTPKLKELLDD